MIKIENIDFYGFEAAIRGMRNPMNSWDKSDSEWTAEPVYAPNIVTASDGVYNFKLGPNDLELMKKLAKGGSVHAKYRRMIVVYMDITAPLYWWKEFDTYRTGVTPNPIDIEMNSCSTMHKIQAKEFTLEDFSHEHLFGFNIPSSYRPDKDCVPIENEEEGVERFWASGDFLEHTILALNFYRNKFLETKDKRYWWQMIQLLPSSYNQRRTVMLNYEALSNIYASRKDHKQDEWRIFCQTMKDELPCSVIFTGED